MIRVYFKRNSFIRVKATNYAISDGKLYLKKEKTDGTFNTVAVFTKWFYFVAEVELG